MKNKNISGRSLIEIIGVISVIGILSVVVLNGYQLALTKKQSNDWVYEVNLRMNTAHQMNDSFSNGAFTLVEFKNTTGKVFEYNKTADGITITASGDDLNADICSDILSRGINDYTITSIPNCENVREMTFTQKHSVAQSGTDNDQPNPDNKPAWCTSNEGNTYWTGSQCLLEKTTGCFEISENGQESLIADTTPCW